MLDKAKLLVIFELVETEHAKRQQFFNIKTRISQLGDIECRSFGTSFIFYIDGQRWVDFTLEIDPLGKVSSFVAPALVRTTVFWDRNEQDEPIYHMATPGLLDVLYNNLENHFKTAK